MQTDRFIAHVNRACPALDPDSAHRATLITLESLCEHVPDEQTRRMASQLPDELAEAVNAGGKRGETTDVPVSLEDFHGKIMFRTELGENDAKRVAAAVAQTLSAALSDGEAEEVAIDLPPDLDQLMAQ